jgi:predicted  nucleic acid-binding Zn-ribbon protein
MSNEPRDDSNADPVNITEERAARRFHQMRHVEENIAKLDVRITGAKDKLAALKDQRDGLLEQLRAAARDEGDLPLFDDL